MGAEALLVCGCFGTPLLLGSLLDRRGRRWHRTDRRGSRYKGCFGGRRPRHEWLLVFEQANWSQIPRTGMWLAVCELCLCCRSGEVLRCDAGMAGALKSIKSSLKVPANCP